MQQRKYFEPLATVGRKRIPSPDFPSAVSDLLDGYVIRTDSRCSGLCQFRL